MTRTEMEMEIQALRARADDLERQLAPVTTNAPPFYWVYHVLAGFSLGAVGASMSLLFNIVGSLLVGQHPLHLIRVYLTFPMGDEVLQSGDNGFILAIGCCVYLITGMFLGIPFHLALRRLPADTSFLVKFLIVSGLACVLWVINFYLILSWLQPLLYGGRWIVDLVPWWVGLLTHLVFGWTMLLVQPFGAFEEYSNRVSTEVA